VGYQDVSSLHVVAIFVIPGANQNPSMHLYSTTDPKPNSSVGLATLYRTALGTSPGSLHETTKKNKDNDIQKISEFLFNLQRIRIAIQRMASP